jgi:hypothetical protein
VDYDGAVVLALHSREPNRAGGLPGGEQLAWVDGTLARR